MDTSRRTGSKRIAEPVDDWLRNEGFFRKNAPHDATCLFRAVSEQIYLTQYYHLKVREQCVRFMKKNEAIFKKDVKMPFNNYLDQLACVTEWGGEIEIQAIAQLYKRDFVMFDASTLARHMVTNNGFKNIIHLCQLGPKIYESIFERATISNAGFCQSLMYRTLYKDVFQMPSVDNIVQKMLHERNSKISLRNNPEQRNCLATEFRTKVDTEGCTPQRPKFERAPFPYRVAKALDPTIYRNIDFDIWHELRKEIRCSGWTCWNNSELQIGAKCLVQLDESNWFNTNGKKISPNDDGNSHVKDSRKVPALLIGHIQEMSKDGGPVVVFIEEPGEKKTVPFVSLKPLLATRKSHLPLRVISPRRRAHHDPTPKYRTKGIQCRKSNDILGSVDHNGQDYNLNLSNQWEEHNIDNHRSRAQRPAVALKPFLSVDDCNNNVSDYANTLEAWPVSFIVDDAPTMMSHSTDVTIQNEGYFEPLAFRKTKHEDNHLMMEHLDAYGESQGQEQPQGHRQVQKLNQCHGSEPATGVDNTSSDLIQPTSLHEPPCFYPHSMTMMYTPNPALLCISEMHYSAPYHQQPESGLPALTDQPIQERSLHLINMTATVSNDATGADLPYSDPITLRFFYNLGIEAFRSGHLWTPGAITSQSFVPTTHGISIGAPVAPAGSGENLPKVPSPTKDEDVAEHVGSHAMRKDNGNERNSAKISGMSSDSRGSYKLIHSKKEENFQATNANLNFMYELKNHSYSEDKYVKNGRDPRDQKDHRKNVNRLSNNNYRKNNRSLNLERTDSFLVLQKEREHQGQNSFSDANDSVSRRQNDMVSHQRNLEAPGGRQQFLGTYQQSSYGEVYYASGGQRFYPANSNFLFAPSVGDPQEDNENADTSASYVCGSAIRGIGNIQPSMSPMCLQYVCPSTGVYPGINSGGQESWYFIGGNQPFIPYQMPLPQPLSNVPRSSTIPQKLRD